MACVVGSSSKYSNRTSRVPIVRDNAALECAPQDGVSSGGQFQEKKKEKEVRVEKERKKRKSVCVCV